MRRVGATAAADQVDAVLGDEALLPLGELAGAQRIMRVAMHQLRQAGIGLDRDEAAPILAEPFHMLGHLVRAGGAVEADDRYVERADHGGRRGDVGADQQRAGGLDRRLDEDRDVLPGLGAGALGAVDRRLDLQRVLAGLDQDGVNAAGDQALGLDRERVLELLIVDMAERRQARPRPHRADDEARAPVARELFDRLARQLAGAPVEREGPVGDAELAERDG